MYVTPTGPAPATVPVVILCHELPRDPGGPTDAGRGYPALADRLAEECGCRVVVGMLRGTGGSGGDFSADGWLEDLSTIAGEAGAPHAGDPVPTPPPTTPAPPTAAPAPPTAPTAPPLWLIGFGFGGAIALRAAASDPRVRGVASVAGPADLTAWAANRQALLQRCRRSGVIHTEGFPEDVDTWAAEIVALSPLQAAAQLGTRPLLVAHGSDDDEVPVAAARALADAATDGPVDLRVVPGAGHWLRADPRVVATLVGWIERHR